MENTNSIGYAPVFGAGILVDAARGMFAVNFLVWLLTLGDREDLHEDLHEDQHEGLLTRIARLETRDAAAERAWQSLSERVEALEAKVPRINHRWCRLGTVLPVQLPYSPKTRPSCS